MQRGTQRQGKHPSEAEDKDGSLNVKRKRKVSKTVQTSQKKKTKNVEAEQPVDKEEKSVLITNIDTKFGNVPVSLIIEIFVFFPIKEILLNLCLTCHAFYQPLLSKQLWKHMKPVSFKTLSTFQIFWNTSVRQKFPFHHIRLKLFEEKKLEQIIPLLHQLSTVQELDLLIEPKKWFFEGAKGLPITKLRISHFQTLPYIKPLQTYFPNLHHLSFIYGCTTLRNFMIFIPTTGIKTLIFHGMRGFVDNTESEAGKKFCSGLSTRLSTLERLKIAEPYDGWEMNSIWFWELFHNLKKLRVLELDLVEILDPDHISVLGELRCLEKLSLQIINTDEDDDGNKIFECNFSWFRTLLHLQFLSLDTYGFKDEDFRFLSSLKKLHTLKLSCCWMTGKGLQYLQTIPFKILELGCGGYFDSSFLIHIDTSNLEELTITRSEFGKFPSLNVFPVSLSLLKLKSLDLSHTDIDDKWMKELPSMPQLVSLDISGCQNVTCINHIRSHFPKLTKLATFWAWKVAC